MELTEAVRRFLEDCELAQGLSERTVANYQHYLERFALFADGTPVERIDDELVRRWRLDLNRNEALGRATQNYHLVALRAFLAWLARHNIASLASDKIELPGVDEPEVSFLQSEAVEKLLSMPDQATDTGKRDKAVLETLFSTGLRVAELVRLDRGDVEGREEVSVLGKGKKRRVVFLSPSAQAAITSYLKTRVDADPALFIRERVGEDADNRLTVRTIQRILKHYAALAGVAEHVTPHTLRHSFATDLLRSGADLRSVQALLGHSSVVTTQRYTHLTDTHLKEVHQAFHGREQRRDLEE